MKLYWIIFYCDDCLNMFQSYIMLSHCFFFLQSALNFVRYVSMRPNATSALKDTIWMVKIIVNVCYVLSLIIKNISDITFQNRCIIKLELVWTTRETCFTLQNVHVIVHFVIIAQSVMNVRKVTISMKVRNVNVSVLNYNSIVNQLK